jgi:hypothetical protein
LSDGALLVVFFLSLWVIIDPLCWCSAVFVSLPFIPPRPLLARTDDIPNAACGIVNPAIIAG